MPSSTRHRRRLWQGCLSVGFLLGLISSAAAQDHRASPAQGPPAPGIEVEVANGLLTLHADGAPLAEVLRAVGAAGGFPVVLRGAFAAPVRDAFAAQPLDRAIRRLADGHSLVILHGEAVPGQSARAIAELQVIEQQGQAASEDPVPTGVTRAPAEEEAEQGAGEFIDREEFRRRAAADGTPPPTKDDILLELLLPDQEARLAAVPKVGALRPHEAAQVLSEVFAAETDSLVRSRAVAAATRLRGRAGAMLLGQRALGDDDPELRMQALNALAASGNGRIAPVLGQALLQDPEPRVRLSALQALQRVGGDTGPAAGRRGPGARPHRPGDHGPRHRRGRRAGARHLAGGASRLKTRRKPETGCALLAPPAHSLCTAVGLIPKLISTKINIFRPDGPSHSERLFAEG